jgi:hypothetical protein
MFFWIDGSSFAYSKGLWWTNNINNNEMLLRLMELDWDSARHLLGDLGVNGGFRPFEVKRLSLSSRSQKTFDWS